MVTQKLTKTVVPMAFFLVLSAALVSAADLNPVYRFYNANNGDHFYVFNNAEMQKVLDAGVYMEENIAFYAYPTQISGTLPVYRFYNANNGDHFYTMKEGEKDKLMNTNSGYVYENVAFYAYQEESSAQKVANLRVEDKSRSWILWEWTNPGISFDGIAVFIDGENVANLSNSVSSYKASRLNADESYTITLKLIIDGQVSSVGVSNKAYTSSNANPRSVSNEGETPVVFTSSLSNGTVPSEITFNENSSQTSGKTGLSVIYYVIIALVVLSILALFLIFRYI